MTGGWARRGGRASDTGVLARGLAAVVALMVGAAALVVAPPRPAAAEEVELVPTSIAVTQPAPWTSLGDRVLDVVVTTADGTVVDEGRIVADIDGVPGTVSSTVPTGPLVVKQPLLPGRYGASIEYRPAEGYAASTWNGEVVVQDGTIPTTVEVSAPDVVPFDEQVVLDVGVTSATGTPEGKVGIWWDGDPWPSGFYRSTLVDGRATVRVLGYGDPGTLGVTRHFSVVYYPAGDMQTSSAADSFTRGRTTRELEIWFDRVWDGVFPVTADPWDVSVYVPDLYYYGPEVSDGTISLYEGDRLLRSKPFPSYRDGDPLVVTEFRLSEKDLPVGKHRLTARLTGATYVKDASTSWSMSVEKLRTTTDPSRGTADLLRFGDTMKLGAGVMMWRNSGEPRATGTLTFYEGSTRLGSTSLRADGYGGTLTLGNKRLAIGKHKIRAVYSGDENYRGSSGTSTIGVWKALSKVKVRLSDRPVPRGERLKIKVRVTSPSDIALTGKVKVKVDGRTVKTVTLRKRHDGRTTITMPHIDTGKHRLKIVYVGNDKTKRSVAEPNRLRFL
ncbi:Ig-like domain-containing protein [Isoptericola jiangsuensis]|uniref:Ig-like domain-containing protein n=1 Tax=Isoptericola jiangsuensis TaxID=548579 RepID=A0A2A9F077_9MICO|nr:Ig-like domain-containing protein [Isoptericola jiangsuensis]PFG44548.1 Ig-like domain-containing protein [Isoptericola jiangsuensis]